MLECSQIVVSVRGRRRERGRETRQGGGRTERGEGRGREEEGGRGGKVLDTCHSQNSLVVCIAAN